MSDRQKFVVNSWMQAEMKKETQSERVEYKIKIGNVKQNPQKQTKWMIPQNWAETMKLPISICERAQRFLQIIARVSTIRRKRAFTGNNKKWSKRLIYRKKHGIIINIRWTSFEISQKYTNVLTRAILVRKSAIYLFPLNFADLFACAFLWAFLEIADFIFDSSLLLFFGALLNLWFCVWCACGAYGTLPHTPQGGCSLSANGANEFVQSCGCPLASASALNPVSVLTLREWLF